MKSKKINNGCVIRLEKGEKIIENLTNFLEEEQIRNGFFIGLGALSKVELALYRLEDKKYFFKEFKEALEISSLHGNIFLKEGKPFIHAHIVVSDEDMVTHGGHLKEAIVGPTCEIIFIELENEIKKEYDEEIGLWLLDI